MGTTAKKRKQQDIKLKRDPNRQSHFDLGIVVGWTYCVPGWEREPSTKKIKKMMRQRVVRTSRSKLTQKKDAMIKPFAEALVSKASERSQVS